jgi:hypothetical protein
MTCELFQPQEFLPVKWYLFKDSRLGKIYDSIPWDQLADCLPEESKGPGAPRWFSAHGMFGLMFLKSYLKISDEKLIERFNTDWSLQLFCNKLLKEGQRIRDKAIVSRIRTYIAENTEWQQLQDVLINHWKRDMNNTHVLLMDATCYESYVRFPTDVKLLWESCHWVFEKQLYRWCKILGVKRPRSKYVDQKRLQLDFDRRRKKPYKLAVKRRKTLIYLLQKGIHQLQSILDAHPQIELNHADRGYLRTIRKVLEQQQFLLTHPAKELKGRIVSLPRPYVRPIIRGKETKRLEFGMKVHMLQVDGICMIDHMSFNAFNESTRLKISTLKHRSTFGHLFQLGADKIYANNPNRKYLTGKKIFTCFPRKGPQIDTKAEKKLRSILASQRATVMEGSFGVHKTSYGLDKIKAKGVKREMIWVFFGVMTANAVKISKQIASSPPLQLAA